MRVWRLARAAHPALDGDGARRVGGRWNSPGVAVVYTSGTLALAALELLAHTDPDLVPRDLRAFEVDIPDAIRPGLLDPASLPRGWRAASGHPDCRAAGDAWVQAGDEAVLGVPSALIPEERNYLLNPAHAQAARVRVVRARPFAFDARLL